MDTLPTSSSSSDDLSSYTGTYPSPAAGNEPPPPPAAAPTPPAPTPAATTATTPTLPDPFPQPVVASGPSQSGLAPQPDAFTVAATPDYSTNPPPVPQPVAAPSAFADQFSQPAPVVDASSSVPATSFDAGGVANPPPEVPPVQPAADNPFVAPADGAKPPAKPGGSRRLLFILLGIVGLLILGFGAFMVFGRLLSSGQPKVITYWGLWEKEAIMQPLIDEYKRSHPNVEIAYTQQDPQNYRDRLQSAIARDEGPDIFRFHNTWVPMLEKELAPAGKTGYTAAEFKESFYPVAVKDVVIGNDVYGVPLEIDGLAMYYNEDLLRNAGITPPTDWNAFRNAATTVTVKDATTGQIVVAGAALGTTGNIEHFGDILGLMFLQNGVDLKNPVGKRAEEALAFYTLFAEEPNNVWDDAQDNSIKAFAAGKVAFMFAPSWQAFEIHNINPQLKFQIIPVPQIPDGEQKAWATYWVEGVSTKSKNQDEAWEFLKFLSSKEQLTTFYSEAAKDRELFGEPYSRIDLAQSIINDPYVGAYINQAQIADSFFLASRTFDRGVNDRIIQYATDAVNSVRQGASPDEALTTMAAGFKQVLSSFAAP